MQADAIAQEFSRVSRETGRAQHAADGAQNTADKAILMVSEHEKLCLQRYTTISTRLDDIPKLFTMLGKIQVIVYMGVGIWVGAPIIAGAIYGMMQIVKLMGH